MLAYALPVVLVILAPWKSLKKLQNYEQTRTREVGKKKSGSPNVHLCMEKSKNLMEQENFKIRRKRKGKKSNSESLQQW